MDRMVSPGEFNRQLAAAARSMAEESSSQDVVTRAVGLAVELIDGCDVAGVSLVRADGIDTPAATDEALRLIDEAQFRLDEGPCLDALTDHEIVTSNDLSTDARWPHWGPRMVAEADVR